MKLIKFFRMKIREDNMIQWENDDLILVHFHNDDDNDDLVALADQMVVLILICEICLDECLVDDLDDDNNKHLDNQEDEVI